MQRNSDFSSRVKLVVRGIPRGNTLSYKEVATRAGNPKASRAVAMIMSRNDDITIPCHRVICSNGTIGGYNGLRKSTKRQLLQEEGIKFK
jgi:methylated-DNA-[protein]-cysteine S-methyltransferase